MKSRNVVRMFLNTLFLGAIAAIITSFFVKTNAYLEYLQPLDLYQLLGVFLFIIGYGLVFSLISQMGFFAYLTVNQFGLGVLRKMWQPLQALLVIVSLVYLVYSRFQTVDDVSPIIYTIIAVGLLVFSWIVASIKAKETNRDAFIPALFFMVVVTIIEWVPGLRTGGSDYTWIMFVCLLVCNAYQLLLLHRITETKSEKSKTA